MKRNHLKVLLAVEIVAAFYLAWGAETSWIPHDEGMLGQAAERVLLGELPHVDFDDPYTGGLSFLHAAAFGVFGIRLSVLRWLLFGVSLAFVAALFQLASRAAGPAAAGAATLLAVAWGPPVYFAALPSWYNLFFATFGTLALIHHVETGRRRWLVAAGLAGGVSILFKSIGLFYLAAAVLFLIYREQEESRDGDGTKSAWSFGLFSWIPLAAVGIFLLLLIRVVLFRPSWVTVYHFLLPGIVLGGLLVWNELHIGHAGAGVRWRRLAGSAGLLLAAAAIPVAVFLVPFVAASGVGDLLHGVFVLPRKRFDLVAIEAPALATLTAVLPLATLLIAPRACRGRGPVAVPAALGALLAIAGAALLAFGDATPVHRAIWYSVRPLGTVAVVLGGWRLARADLDAQLRQKLFLLLAMTAMVGLVQFPVAHGIYFCYLAPLLVITLLHLISAQPRAPRRVWAGVAVFYLLFALIWVHRGLVLATGDRYWPVTEDTRIVTDRAGLYTAPRLATVYQRLAAVAQEHSSPGAYIYATPDCPEVYFLSARRNPTRTFYDLFEDDFEDPERRRRRLLAMLDERRIDVVVLHGAPRISGPVDAGLAAEVARRFPHREELPTFTVYWR